MTKHAFSCKITIFVQMCLSKSDRFFLNISSILDAIWLIHQQPSSNNARNHITCASVLPSIHVTAAFRAEMLRAAVCLEACRAQSGAFHRAGEDAVGAPVGAHGGGLLLRRRQARRDTSSC